MDDTIAEIYLLYPTAKAICGAVTLAYSDLEDPSQMFDLRHRSRNLRQDEGTVSQYFSSLTKLWQELDLFTQPAWIDTANSEIYRKLLAKERTYDFLTGLNPILDDVRGRILSIKPVPSLDAIFSKVLREEQRRHIMLGGSSMAFASSINSDASAMAARFPDSRGPRKPLWCDHCNRPHYTKETCRKLHGKPADWVPRGQRKSDGSKPPVAAKSDAASSSSLTFTQAQLNQIGQLFSSSTSLMTHGISSSTVNESATSGEFWIIDSGASEQKSSTRTIFSSYSRYSGTRTVTLADSHRSVSPVV